MKLINKKVLLANTKLQIFLGTIMVILCVMVWPIRYFHHSSVSGYQETQVNYTDAVTMEEIVLQEFVPSKDYIHEISIQGVVTDVHAMDRVFVTIYNAEFEFVYQEVLYFTDIRTRGYIQITPEIDVVPGDTYYVGLNVHFDSIGTLCIAYARSQDLQIEECRSFAYGTGAYPEQTILMEFQYTAPYSTGLMILCFAGIIAGAVLLYVGSCLLWEILKRKKLLRQAQKLGLGVGLVIGVAIDMFCFYQLCIAKIFGGEIWDMIVYVLACLIALLVLVYACYKGAYRVTLLQRRDYKIAQILKQKKKRLRKPKMPEILTKGKQSWNYYLRITALVCLFWSCMNYVNAPVQWKQDQARNAVFLLFGLFVLLTFKLREVFNLYTMIFGLLMIPVGVVYTYSKGPDVHDITAARILIIALVLWGIVLIRTIQNIRSIKMQKVNIPMAACWGLMAVFMLFNSYGKLWPVLMVVCFTLFYLQNYTDEERDVLVHQLMIAILVQFGTMVFMCFMHRPYHYYQFIRYPMWFHTVASTGMYLAMVEAAALLLLFIKLRDTGTLFRKTWKEWILNGVVLAYISLTVARTAIIAVLGMCVILAIGSAIVYRPRITSYLRIAGMLVLVLVLGIPVVYTTTRCIPAVVNEPVYLNGAEDFDFAIREGEALDSDSYMYFRALVRLWARRFWVPEDFIQTYLEDKVSMKEELYLLAELASTEVTGLSEGVADAGGTLATANDMSNGRLAIFKEYLEHLSWKGHPKMGYDGDYALMSGHAHNSFIQNAFDFGIPAGLLFLGLILAMIFTAVVKIWTGKERSEKQFMLLLMASAFILVSLTEYSSHPCMPLGFSTLFMLITMRTEKNVVE